jgi:hypothetical protein
MNSMNVTSIRKSSGANGDPLREALAVAITKAKKAEAEYERHREAVGRARELVRTNKAKLEAAATAIEEARESDAAELAKAISTGGASSARGLRQARIAETEATDNLEMAQTAAHALWADNTAERESERAGMVVASAVAAVLEPVTRQLLDESKNLQERDWSIQQRLTVIRDAIGYKHPLHAEIEKSWNRSPASEEVLQRSMAIQKDWKAAIEALKADADAPLPGAPA